MNIGADTLRLLGDLAREGVVESVDLRAGTARVRFGDLVTGDIPWLAARAGKMRIYAAPSVGEQVVVISPEGRTSAAIIIGSLSSDQHPHPADDSSAVIAFDDGAEITYDPDGHFLIARLPAGSFVQVEADDIYLRGNLHVTGTVEATGDVVGAGKSLRDHVHLAVQPGQGVSGKPQ
ncbi:phage baseplate assembly protein V [uncultured Sphingomonas sp.]|uniref:phage baseplate assembly protein V n=1 Tax=uncultured Sphingomonas sp. TaxID=158754 RepID=UPI0025DAAB60|nr:phage baseplate assembly protein V [uncultured Sphingomonas sp.]